MPRVTPEIIEIGIEAKERRSIAPLWFAERNDENNTITKISSSEDPANIISGILLSFPYPFSISSVIFGTTTAGDTAPNTAPNRAASSLEILKIIGAKIVIAITSKVAGKKESSIAGLDAFFKDESSSVKPALINIIIKAIFLNSADIFKIAGESRFNAYGPIIIPTNSIPMIFGSCTL